MFNLFRKKPEPQLQSIESIFSYIKRILIHTQNQGLRPNCVYIKDAADIFDLASSCYFINKADEQSPNLAVRYYFYNPAGEDLAIKHDPGADARAVIGRRNG